MLKCNRATILKQADLKKIILLLITTAFLTTGFAQTEKVKGTLTTIDTADLTILNIYPDSFPNISVLFRAETRKGEPVWNLTKEKMRVKENAQNCNIISLEPISKNKPIHLGIVIDHSGSMLQDQTLLFNKNGNALFEYDDNYNMIYPKGYKSPIESAKTSVKPFVKSFNSKKDFISITGFSTTVDKTLPLTQDVNQINTIVDSMNADLSTALFDAMISSIAEIKKSAGVKVLVVLTDGWDNASNAKWNDVIAIAVKETIPIYIIGLGNVNKDTLQLISNATNGHFYYTRSSSSLNTVYAEISKQVQAYYDLVYSSPNFSAADGTRQVEVSFDVDSLYLVTKASTLNLPEAVLVYMQKKQKQKDILLYGGIITLLLITTGTLLYTYKKRKKNNPVILKLFPNPTDGQINLEYSSGNGQLQILDFNGQVLKTFEIHGHEKQFDLTTLQDGNYIALIRSNGLQSNAVKFALRR